MIQGVIFDVDGVLLDSLEIWDDLSERYVRRYGYEPVRDMSQIIAEMSMEDGAKWIIDTYGMHRNKEQTVLELEEMLKEFYSKEVDVKQGVMELLAYLKEMKIPCICATSCTKSLTIAGLQKNGIDRYIREVITEEDVGKDKHHPDIFFKASTVLHTKVCETLVVEDSLYALKTAEKAGFLTAGIQEKHNQKDSEEIKKTADIYCSDMYELKGIIENENSINNSRK